MSILVIIGAISTRSYKVQYKVQSTNYESIFSSSSVLSHRVIIVVNSRHDWHHFNSKLQSTLQSTNYELIFLSESRHNCLAKLVILSRFVKTRRSSRHRDLWLRSERTLKKKISDFRTWHPASTVVWKWVMSSSLLKLTQAKWSYSSEEAIPKFFEVKFYKDT